MTTPPLDYRNIGRYELRELLGKGSQGSVMLALDPTLDRFVAIKLLSGESSGLNALSDDGTPIEARATSKLNHPNIVPIYDGGRVVQGPFLVFEYVRGEPLSQRIAERELSMDEAVPVMQAVLDAMAHAHASEIVHLDLSPRNILIDERGVPRVMDFGLAQYVNFTRKPGRTATGTLRYMAPEHMLQRPLGPWTDVFALGITFYEMLLGIRPFDGLGTRDIQRRIAAAEPDLTPIQCLPDGEAFARFLAGAFERDREGRYSDAGVMREAFELFLSETGRGGAVRNEQPTHSTVDFMLRRMERKKGFPSVSQTLTDINRLTGEGSDASADQLANVILRDLGLTSKLLKLVNSAYYGTRATEVTSISQAIVFLGTKQVRMTANSLVFFGALRGDSEALKESLVRSFYAGLLARHLAKRIHPVDPEEAFICGMCQNLGENLVMYYFADDYEDICELQRVKELDRNAACRGVLGVGYAEVGAAVARLWKLPGTIIRGIQGMPAGQVLEPREEEEKFRDLAVFANELCECFREPDAIHADVAVVSLLRRFELSINPDPDYLVTLVAAAFEKLKECAPIFEISVSKSAFLGAVSAWLAYRMQSAEADGSADAAEADEWEAAD